MPKREPDPPPPVRPPTLPPDFPDIRKTRAPSLQPPPDSFAVADKVAGTTLGSPETPEARAKVELRSRNARLREKINSVLTQHPELRDATDELALEQGLHAEVRTPVLDG